MIQKVFSTQVAPDLSPEGQAQFGDFIRPEHLHDRLSVGACMLTARVDGKLAGFLEMRIYCHVALLFVTPAHQRKGVAGELLTAAVVRCRQERPCLRAITVNASACAVPAYKKLGFIVTTGEQDRAGIRFTPMTLAVENE
jgi:GNAT superfamily N-acetyltransferase